GRRDPGRRPAGAVDGHRRRRPARQALIHKLHSKKGSSMSTSSIPLVRRGLAALALGIGLLGPAAQAVAADKVRLAQNLSPISGVVIVAKQKGFFDQAGLDVTVVNFTSGKQALEATLGGGADIATTAEAPVTAATMAR